MSNHFIAKLLGLQGTHSPIQTTPRTTPEARVNSSHGALLTFNPDGIPQALRDHPHWLVADRKGKPVSTAESGNSKTTSAHWTDFETASRLATERPGLWPYMVLTDSTRITIFDVDGKSRKAHESEADHTERLRKRDHSLARLREWFPVRYEERSKSGKGFHIIVSGAFQGTGSKGKGDWSEVEVYTRKHGVALTGHIVTGSTVPEEYPTETLQAIRDEIKGRPPSVIEHSSSSHGKVRPEWARSVLAKIAERHPRPERSDWLKIASAVFHGVGVETGLEILAETWPEEEQGEYEVLARTLPHFISWETLRAFGVDPVDPQAMLAEMATLPAESPKATRKSLSDYVVDHVGTLGLSWAEVDALRPPFVIDGFLRQGELLLVGAESKSRKSWLTQDAGFSVALGSPWLADPDGANGFPTRKARVHVVDLELSPSEMRYRFAKARGNRLAESPADAAEMTAQIAAYSLDGLNVIEIRPLLVELKAKVVPGDLVIVDCFYRLCPDGNEVKDVAEILETLKRFASDTQAGLILVDHFRKAGDEKARNRFAGSFVKQASASTLVAIEVTADDVLVLTIDARTFHGCPKVHARFNPETYAFNRLPEHEVEQAKRHREHGEAKGWLLRLWNGRPPESAVTAADAVERWVIKRQGAVPRLGKLVARGWIIETKGGPGKATEWTLAPAGVAVVTPAREDI